MELRDGLTAPKRLRGNVRDHNQELLPSSDSGSAIFTQEILRLFTFAMVCLRQVIADGLDYPKFHDSRRSDVEPLFEVEGRTFVDPGQVGLWTKTGSVTSVDDFEVITP